MEVAKQKRHAIVIGASMAGLFAASRHADAEVFEGVADIVRWMQ